MKAKSQDALEPYKPANWDQVPAGLKDPDGYWTTIHSRHARPVREQGCAGRQAGAGLLEGSVEAGL